MENSSYLGTERLGILLRKFAIPCIFSHIISRLYNIVDQIFVGNGVGYLGNAATGVIFPIMVVGWGLSLFFGDGAAASLSMSLGENKGTDIHRSVGNAILGSFLSGVVVVAVAYLWGDGLLRLIGATDANIQMAHDYGVIIFAMMPLAMSQNTLASIIRADGSPKYAMAAMLTGAVINIIGDPVAIFVWDMGVKGAAWATILGQFVSFLICASYLFRSKTFWVRKDSFKPSPTLLKPVMALGTSSLLTQLSIVVITVVNNILLVRYGAQSVYGEDVPLATFVVIMKLFQIVLNIAIGIAAGAPVHFAGCLAYCILCADSHGSRRNRHLLGRPHCRYSGHRRDRHCGHAGMERIKSCSPGRTGNAPRFYQTYQKGVPLSRSPESMAPQESISGSWSRSD
ncbi:hypothetical protein D1159_15805 [Pseudoflavonifractor sp. 524-17]|uniref:MATE family efflux transporter n=1 Tax=Pseudoflavonifractor sp. 524-17 TaxID=2304577 RepID=UPI00137AA8F6|nr:MATE family efflux transporter [Pseudoflavonifractor sp. 524-17]NCE66004.1 hypothetical protein [Pseudoflavonifractor sp. 524-17]